jgi:ubiquinone/menaquinone biosynthesis C-methylase UbiE
MSFAGEYDDWHRKIFEAAPLRRDDHSPWHKIVLEYMVSVEGKRVLEVACGRGGFAQALASRGGRIFGADFSGMALQIAQNRNSENGNICPHVTFAQADAQQLPYRDQSFDVVISCETIEHLPDPLAGVSEFARVCRTGGLLYLTTPNYFNLMGLYYLYATARGRKATPGDDQPYDRVFLFPQVRRMLTRGGWKIIRCDGTVHQLPIIPGRDPVAVPSAERNRFVRRLLSPLAFHYFVLAQKTKV